MGHPSSSQPPPNIWDNLPKDSKWYVNQARAEIDELANGTPTGYAMGFKTFDGFFRIKPGQLLVVAGRPAMGKTSFALQLAYNFSKHLQSIGDSDGRILFFSAEMTGVQLYHKLASGLSGINLQRGYAGKWSQQDTDDFNRALMGLSGLPLSVSDLNTVTIGRMHEDVADMMAAKVPPRALFFDYIELAADEGGVGEREHGRIAQVAQKLKRLGMQYGIPVVALSQVNRQTDGEANKMPYLSNLAGSDTVSRMADKVLTLMRPGYYLRNGQSAACENAQDLQDTCYVSIQKDRFGKSGQTFRLRVNEQTFMFSDMNPPMDPPRNVMNLKARKPGDFGITTE